MASPIAPVIIDLKIGGFQGVKQAMNDVVRIVDDMNKSTIRSTDKAAKDRVRSEAQAAKEVAKLAQQEAKEKVKAAKEAASATDRIASDEVRKQEGYARNRERIVQNSLRYEQRLREQAARDEEATQKRLQASRERRATRIGGAVGGAVGRGIGVLGRVAGFAASIGGGFAIADALHEGISDEAAAGQIVRSSGSTGGLKKEEVLAKAKGAAIATGSRTGDMLGGLNSFIEKSGDLKGAVDMLDELSSLAALTGARMEDLGNTAGDAFNKIQASGSKDVAGDTVKVMRMLGGEARTGAIDIRELGEYGPRLTASATQYEGNVAENVGSMGALAQIAVKLGGASNARMGTQAVARLTEDIQSKSDDFESLLGSKNVWADKEHHQLRSADKILMSFAEKTKGDKRKIHEYFGTESGFIARGFDTAYDTGYMGVKGRAGMEKAFGEIRGSTLTQEQITAGVADKNGEVQSKLNVALDNFHNSINDKLLPKMPELIDSFSRMIPAITKFIDLIVAHPYGAIIGAAIVSSIGSAGVGAAVAAAIKFMILKGGGGGGGGGVGKGAAIVATAVGAYEAGKAAIDAVSDVSTAGSKGEKRAEIEAGNTESVTSALQSGRISKEEAEKRLGYAKSLIENSKNAPSLAESVVNSATGSGPGVGAAAEQRGFAEHADELKKAIADLAEAIKNTPDSSGGGGNPDGRAAPDDPARRPIHLGQSH